jgi:hypothetical protein
MLPTNATEEALPHQGGHSTIRSTLYMLLALMLVAGAWVRFNGQIASVMPALAGPAEQIADQMGFSNRPRALLELDMLPQPAPKEEVAALGLGASETALLSEALLRRRLRLIHLPLVDVGPLPVADGAGHSVEVSAGGYTRLVHLTRQPITLTLPIAAASTVTFRATDGDAVSIVALTLAGPIRLPDLPAGQSLSVGVVPQ